MRTPNKYKETGGYYIMLKHATKLYQALNPKAKIKAQEKETVSLGMLEVGEFAYHGAYVIEDSAYRSKADIQSIQALQATKIKLWRDISEDPEIDFALENIINDAIVQGDTRKPAITINLEDVDVSDAIKEKVLAANKFIMGLLDVNKNGGDLFRRWYVDGSGYYHVHVGTTPKEGIKKVTHLDSRAIRKVVRISRGRNDDGVEVIESVKTFYIYDTSNIPITNGYQYLRTHGQEIEIPEEEIIHINSGIFKDGIIKSYLDRCVKPLNHFNRMRDMLYIFRITRGIDRRIFYIGTGDMSGKAATKHIKDMANKYKSKLKYDSTTGAIQGLPDMFGIQEDYFMGRSSEDAGKGTEIQNMDGSTEFLRTLDDIKLALDGVRRATKVPMNRFNTEQNAFVGSSLSELERDELMHSKFINRLRMTFSDIFKELLRKQLLLRRIITEMDWKEYFEENIYFEYASDAYIEESRQADILSARVSTASEYMDSGFVGKFVSNEYIRRDILKMTDEDISREDERLLKERKDGKFPDQDEHGNPLPEEEGAF